MAKREVMAAGADQEMELEPSDIELRDPSVVLSVRLDGPTAKALHQLARQRGERVSVLLRGAVVACVRSGFMEQDLHYRVQYQRTAFAVGTRSSWSEESGRGRNSSPDEAWETVAAGTGY
jgi:predicted transcriptional regulator